MAKVAGKVQVTQVEQPKAGKGKDKMTRRERGVKKVDFLITRVNKLKSFFVGAPGDIGAQLDSAVGLLGDAANEIEKLPETWSASGGGTNGAGFKIEEGALVSIRQRKQEAFADLLEQAEMADLTVLKIMGTRCKVQTKSGVAIILPRGSLMRSREAQS